MIHAASGPDSTPAIGMPIMNSAVMRPRRAAGNQ